jgi:hypothetical protein
LNATLPGALTGATLSWADTGAAVNNHGRALLPYTHQDGSAGLVLWTSEKLLVVADVTLDVPTGLESLHGIISPERDRPGRSGLLNDRDQMTFRAGLAGGEEAVYLAEGQ